MIVSGLARMLDQCVLFERLQRRDIHRRFVTGLQEDRRGEPEIGCLFPPQDAQAAAIARLETRKPVCQVLGSRGCCLASW